MEDAQSDKKKSRRSKSLVPLGQLADPSPTGVSRDTVECDLKQIETQLKLVKSLIDSFPAFDDAVRVQHIIHQKLLEPLSQLADASIAEWNTKEEKKSTWLSSAAPTKPKEELKSAAHSSFRWTPEEVAQFNRAVQEIPCNQRGSTKLIQQRIPSKTMIQVRDRLRRYKLEQKLLEQNGKTK